MPLGRCRPALEAATGASGDAGAITELLPTLKPDAPVKGLVVATPADSGLPIVPIGLPDCGPAALRVAPAGKEPARAEAVLLPCGSGNGKGNGPRPRAVGMTADTTPAVGTGPAAATSSPFGTADLATGRRRPVRWPSIEKLTPAGAFSILGDGLAATTPSKGIGRAAGDDNAAAPSTAWATDARCLWAI